MAIQAGCCPECWGFMTTRKESQASALRSGYPVVFKVKASVIGDINVRTQPWRNFPDPGYPGSPPLPSAVGSRVCGRMGSGSPGCWMEWFEEHHSPTLTIAIIPDLMLTMILDYNPGSNPASNPEVRHAFRVLHWDRVPPAAVFWWSPTPAGSAYGPLVPCPYVSLSIELSHAAACYHVRQTARRCHECTRLSCALSGQSPGLGPRDRFHPLVFLGNTSGMTLPHLTLESECALPAGPGCGYTCLKIRHGAGDGDAHLKPHNSGGGGMYLSEFEASLVCIEHGSWPGLHFEILSQNKTPQNQAYYFLLLLGKVTIKVDPIIVF